MKVELKKKIFVELIFLYKKNQFAIDPLDLAPLCRLSFCSIFLAEDAGKKIHILALENAFQRRKSSRGGLRETKVIA